MSLTPKKQLQMAGHFFRHLGKRFVGDGCRQSAAALTYMSLFAVVPLMTLMYSMFSLIPAFQGLESQVQELIFSNFVPQSGAEVQQYLTEFSSQARKLSVVGVVILLITAYLMLTNIEQTFNDIWGTVGSRRGLSSFLLYWGILSLGPLLLGIGLMMHTYLVSFQLLVDEVDVLGITALIFKVLPLVFTWAAFTLLFIAVPNCKVSTRYALIGGLVTAICFELAKIAFGTFIAHSSYTSVYGAFAVFPIFLIWVYLMWIIVLGGAELIRAMETFKTTWRGFDYPDLVAVLIILWECWRKQQCGGSLSNRDIIDTGLEEQHWRRLRDLLLENHLLAETATGRYVLTRDPSQLRLTDIANLSGQGIAILPNTKSTEALGKYPWFNQLSGILNNANQQLEETFSPTIAQLFSEEKFHTKEGVLNDQNS
ncbi:MAG: YihY family inner membrane protein [Porticoccus sp.]|nr:YihY family inner membrane protein [Porticoccus sp.]